MRITHSLLTSSYKRLAAAVYGVSKKDVKVAPPALTHGCGGDSEDQSLAVKVGEDACFVTSSGEDRQILGQSKYRLARLERKGMLSIWCSVISVCFYLALVSHTIEVSMLIQKPLKCINVYEVISMQKFVVT